MTLRLFVDAPLRAGTSFALPPGADRHARVRRVQPGAMLILFDGGGADWPAEVLAVRRDAVLVHVGEPQAVDRELRWPATIALGMPANERMDTLVEKATELGVACIQPLVCERSVLRLDGERAGRKRAHWQAIAVAACEQCGRTRLPEIAPVAALADWLAAPRGGNGQRLLLTPHGDARALGAPPQAAWCALSGPEGGFTPAEHAAALDAGFVPVNLGPRVLRADTAPLVVLAWAGLAG